MARSLGDVMMRVPSDATLSYIPDTDCADLLEWDAEKYRLSMSLGVFDLKLQDFSSPK